MRRLGWKWPPGLTLTTGGVIAGTPTAIGAYTFTVGLSDSRGVMTEQEYSLTVG